MSYEPPQSPRNLPRPIGPMPWDSVDPSADPILVAPDVDTEAEAPKKKGGGWAIAIALVVIAGLVFLFTQNTHHEATESEYKADAKRACQEQFIPARLKAPATAEYSGVTVMGSDGVYTVAGSVDSQNSFGALLRATFTCSVHLSGDQWALEAATVSG